MAGCQHVVKMWHFCGAISDSSAGRFPIVAIDLVGVVRPVHRRGALRRCGLGVGGGDEPGRSHQGDLEINSMPS